MTLRQGDHGPAVADLQRKLNARGASPALKCDGNFGPKTKAAVEAFQRGVGFVVIDNTTGSIAEMAPYVALGMAYGYEIEVVRVRCVVEVAAARSGDLAGLESLLAHDVVLVGDGGANVLSGLGGSDTLNGGGGADTVNGGADFDQIVGDTGDDVFRFQNFSGANTVCARLVHGVTRFFSVTE